MLRDGGVSSERGDMDRRIEGDSYKTLLYDAVNCQKIKIKK